MAKQDVIDLSLSTKFGTAGFKTDAIEKALRAYEDKGGDRLFHDFFDNMKADGRITTENIARIQTAFIAKRNSILDPIWADKFTDKKSTKSSNTRTYKQRPRKKGKKSRGKPSNASRGPSATMFVGHLGYLEPDLDAPNIHYIIGFSCMAFLATGCVIKRPFPIELVTPKKRSVPFSRSGGGINFKGKNIEHMIGVYLALSDIKEKLYPGTHDWPVIWEGKYGLFSGRMNPVDASDDSLEPDLLLTENIAFPELAAEVSAIPADTPTQITSIERYRSKGRGYHNQVINDVANLIHDLASDKDFLNGIESRNSFFLLGGIERSLKLVSMDPAKAKMFDDNLESYKRSMARLEELLETPEWQRFQDHERAVMKTQPDHSSPGGPDELRFAG